MNPVPVANFGSSKGIDGKVTAGWLHAAIDQTRILDSLSVAVCICEAHTGTIQYFNEHAAALWGCAPARGDMLPYDQTPMVEALKSGVLIRDREVVIERPDGARIIALASIDPLRNESREIVGAVNILRDVTEQKRAELELRRREQELADFVENANVGLHWVGPDGAILWTNDAELKMLGYTREEYVGRNIRDFHVDDDVITDILQRLACGQDLKGYESRMRCKDGSIRYVSINSSVLWEDGRFVHTRCFTRDITNEKRTEDSQYRLASIVESSEDAIVSKDLNGIITSWNKGAESVFGYAASEAIGKPIAILAVPDRANEMPEILHRVRQGKRVESYETVRRRKDGRAIDISLTVSPIRDREGRIIGASKIARDITERKLRDKELHRLQAQRAAIVDSALDCLITIDGEGRIHDFNPAAEETFGYKREEAIGRELAGLILPPSRREAHRQGLARVLATGESRVTGRRLELMAMRADGSEFPIEMAVSVVRTGDGVLFIGFLHDISKRKRQEQERTLLLAQERDARNTAELLNHIAPTLLAELDPEKLVQFITDTATALVGAEFGSFFHNVINEKGESDTLYTLSGVSREAFAGFAMPQNVGVFGPAFRGAGIVRCDDITLDPLYGKDPSYDGMPNGYLPVRSYLAAPVVARSGEVLGGLFFGHPLPGKFTAQHETILAGIAAQAAIAMDNAGLFEKAQWAQNELKRSNEDLRRANQDLETFAYSASHDLQEPLRNIAISAQLLERSSAGQLDTEGESFLADILTGARRMDRLVQDLLAYTMATKHAEGPPPTIHSGAVLSGVLESLKERIEQAGGSVIWKDLPVVSVHEGRLAQVFQNLIGNALKYRSADAPRIQISAIQHDRWQVFSVVDNGIGIDTKYANQIFGLFKRLHSREQYPGTGIGLAICQRIVEQYGGRIWLEESAPGHGSTFCFSVPVGTIAAAGAGS